MGLGLRVRHGPAAYGRDKYGLIRVRVWARALSGSYGFEVTRTYGFEVTRTRGMTRTWRGQDLVWGDSDLAHAPAVPQPDCPGGNGCATWVT
jgi:hypothetical protein